MTAFILHNLPPGVDTLEEPGNLLTSEYTITDNSPEKWRKNRRKRDRKDASPNVFCPVVFRQNSSTSSRRDFNLSSVNVAAVCEGTTGSTQSISESDWHKEITRIRRRRPGFQYEPDVRQHVLGETDLRVTKLSKPPKLAESVLTKKQISKYLKKHRKELRKMRAEKRKPGKTVSSTSKCTSNVHLNGTWLPNLSVSSHGQNNTTSARIPARKRVQERNHGPSTPEGSGITVQIMDCRPPGVLIPPNVSLKIPTACALPGFSWPATFWPHWVCNVSDHCHFPSNHGDTHEAVNMRNSEKSASMNRDDSPKTEQQECSLNSVLEPFMVSGVTTETKSDNQWQSLSAILPFISDTTEYIEETGKEVVEEIHVLDEEVTGKFNLDSM